MFFSATLNTARLAETIDKIEENSNNSNDYLQEDEGPVVSETKVPSTILQVLIHLFKSAEYRKEYVSFLKNSLTRKSK